MIRRLLLGALVAGALLPRGAARAADVPAGGSSLSAARRVEPSRLRRPGEVSVAVSGGYGYTESVLGLGDAHHRLAGALAIQGAPLSWLGLGLRLDGRYDRHSFAAAEGDDGWTGEPRLFVRADGRLDPTLSVGGRATVFFPGGEAPSIEPGATTADLLALATWTPAGGRLDLSANAGYRLDRTSRLKGDRAMLAPGDRLALEVSRFDAALLGLAALHRGDAVHLFAEWSWSLLLGSGAPGAGVSPMRLGAGARLPVGSGFSAELLAEISPSGRPPATAAMPEIPVPPRFAVVLGLVGHFGGPARPQVAEAAPPEVALRPAPRATLAGRLLFGGALPASVTVVVTQGGQERRVAPDEGGGFRAAELAPGAAVVRVEAEGYEPASAQVELRPGATVAIELSPRRLLPSGQLRGTVRSFDGKGLLAAVRIVARDAPDAAPQELRAQGGAFQVDVQPGEYEVTISAPGFASQTRTVKVEQQGVTVLNADLRRAR